jgi:Golgi SNAP receptor complex protein 2
VQKFKSDYAEFRKELERIKEEVRCSSLALHPSPTYNYDRTQRSVEQRTELFSTSTGTPLTPGAGRRRFATASTSDTAPESPFRPNGGVGAHAYLGASREAHALHEHDFLRGTEARLDEFLAQGREVLDSLVDQRAMLKGTQRRLRDAATTLGLSRDVVGWIERRRCVGGFFVPGVF